MSKKKSWAVAVLLQKTQKSGGITMCMMLSVHPGNEDEAMGHAVKSCKEDKPGFVIADIITQRIFE